MSWTTGLSKAEIEWASQHDWFIRSSDQGYVIVRDWTKDGKEVPAMFQDFNKLKAWAGY